ncbi:hypothetical protein REPUB_Repub09cG0067500 [Reevesia pubescens]
MVFRKGLDKKDFWFEWDDTLAEANNIHFDVDVSVDEMDENDGPWTTVQFTKKEKESMRKPWRKALIVKLFGNVLGFQTLTTRIKNPWQLTGRYKVVDLGHDYFLFRFEKKSDYNNVLEGGPWISTGHCLTVRQWTPNFDLVSDKIEEVIAWIRFPCLPVEYYNVLALTKMSCHVGRVIRLDKNTKEAICGRYARVCVELDLTKPLLSKLRLEKSSLMNENDDHFGPWMTVPPRKRPPFDYVSRGKGKSQESESSGKKGTEMDVDRVHVDAKVDEDLMIGQDDVELNMNQEPHISGNKAKRVIRRLGFDETTTVDVVG